MSTIGQAGSADEGDPDIGVESESESGTTLDGFGVEDAQKVTLSVCVRDGAGYIDECMGALTNQTWRPLEIVAVDDGSTDGGAERLAMWHDPNGVSDRSNGIPITVLRRSASGLSAGRNAALEVANGDWFAITDIDCRPDPNWIEEMMQVREGREDESVAAITGRTVFAEGGTRVSKLRAGEIERKYRGRSRIATLANGPCSMFDSSLLRRIGGFDPDWYHAEDMEVSLKLMKDGGSIIHTPYAIVHHLAEEPLMLFLRKRRRDARAHMRIVRIHGLGGAIGPDGGRLAHDFTGDSKLALFLLPLYAASYCVLHFLLVSAGLPDALASIPIPAVALSILAFTLLTDRYMYIRLLWSLALWRGVVDGSIDALLARNGHPSLFSRKR